MRTTPHTSSPWLSEIRYESSERLNSTQQYMNFSSAGSIGLPSCSIWMLTFRIHRPVGAEEKAHFHTVALNRFKSL